MSLHRPISLLSTLVLVAALVVLPQSPAASAVACPTNGIPFTSTLSNGTVKIGQLDPATGASATVCGVVDFQPDLSLLATIPRENLTFAPLSVPIGELGLLDVEVRITAASDFTGPVSFGADGIHIALSGQVVAEADLLLTTCTIGPFRTALTTDTSGALTGAPFAGSDPANLTGKLVGNEDPVPGANHTWKCPLLVSGIFNAIAGLPSPAGESSLTFDGQLTLTPTAAAALRR
ncbi:hypothetical protein WEI85_44290 [Actinomycetes bacterium KLBMP 9797]